MRFLVVALAAACMSSAADAQIFTLREPRLRDQFIFGFSAFPAIPVGEFRKHEKIGGGLEVTVGFQPFRRRPLVLRSELGGMIYDRFSENYNDEVCDTFGNDCTTETLFYDSHTHYMSFLQAGPELMATGGKWRPYGFALAGATFFNSTARFGPAGSTSSNPKSLFASQNFSTSYGIGVRLMTKPNGGREGGWDFALRVTRNAKARFLTKEGVFRNADGTYDLSPRSGAATVLLIHLGVTGGPWVNWNER
jgi:hypothetical protein